jgi:hypothetical protein
MIRDPQFQRLPKEPSGCSTLDLISIHPCLAKIVPMFPGNWLSTTTNYAYPGAPVIHTFAPSAVNQFALAGWHISVTYSEPSVQAVARTNIGLMYGGDDAGGTLP